MKKQIYKLILLMIPIMFLFSCNKDKFSEKDALDAQQTIDFLVTVIDGSSSLAPVQGATVKVISDSTTVSKLTNENGTVVFPKIEIGGDAVIFVSKDNFTSVLKTSYTSPDSYRQTQVSEIVTLYSLESDKIATFQGRLTMQSDLTDRDREPAAGVVVKAKNQELFSTTEQIFTATTDNDGRYTISVPVSSNGDDIRIYYPEFTVNQKLAFVQDDQSVAVAERPVLYKSDSEPVSGAIRSIPAIPSIYATIAPPSSTAGSGFALGAKANRVPLSNFSDAYLIDGGAGYNGGVTLYNHLLSFSPDPNGLSAQLQVDIVNGKITNIDNIVDNGAAYSSQPTLAVNDLSPAIPATIAIAFQTNYKIYISNRGTNYISYPLVSIEAESYSSGTKVKTVDSNIDDNSNAILGVSNILSNYSIIYGGIIKCLSNGDTLINSTYPFSSAPVFTVTDMVSKPAVLSVNISCVNTDGTIASIYLPIAGSGYNPSAPPAVTMNTLAGYGSGAVAKATVTAWGSVAAIYVINPGTQYVRNVNDFRNAGVTTSTFDYPSFPGVYYNGIKPGDMKVQDVYYGTGYQIIDQNTGK